MTKRRPLFMEVADKLTALILEEYSPGSKIPNETELSERYGVSRTTVREAVKSLCSKNILEIRRGDGTYVTKKTGVVADPLGLQFINAVDRINDLAEFSLIMQPEAAALAARKSTPLDMKYLTEANQALKDGIALYEDGKISALALRNLDRAFHGSVMKSCHNYLMDRLDTILKESVGKQH